MSIYECHYLGDRFFIEASDEEEAEFLACCAYGDGCECIRRVPLDYALSTGLEVYLSTSCDIELNIIIIVGS